MIKAILFDIDKVLFDETFSDFFVWQEIFENAKKNTGKPVWVLRQELKNVFPFPSIEWFDWNEKLKKIGCSLRWEELQKKHAGKLEVFEEVPAVLEKLKSMVRLFAVTDGFDYSQKVRLSETGLLEHFEDCFYSNKVGKIKADPGYFETILKSIGLEESEVLFVDDSEYAVSKAEKAGIKSIRVCRCEVKKTAAHYVISSLRELDKIIEKHI